MNSYRPRGVQRRAADALLTSLVEEAIVETLDQTPERQPEPVEHAEPASPEAFLEDVAAFLRARPDAADLLRQLRAMVLPPDPPSEEASDQPVQASEPASHARDEGPQDEPDA